MFLRDRDSGAALLLKPDHIREYLSGGRREPTGETVGFLHLKVQWYWHGDEAKCELRLRGQRRRDGALTFLTLYDSLRHATRTDGTPVFTTATCLSLLVFYILAAQCLPTSAVVRRETNSLKWPLFQIIYMTGLAYVAAFVVYQILRHLGYG